MSAAALSNDSTRGRRKLAFVLLFTFQPLLGLGYQVSAESAARALGERTFGWSWLSALIQAPWAWAAVAFDILALAAWLIVLSEFSLGVAFAMTSVGYILVIAASVLIFNEPLRLGQILGSGLIICGIAFMLQGGRQPQSQTQ